MDKDDLSMLAATIDARDILTMIRADRLTTWIEEAYLSGRCIRCGGTQDEHLNPDATPCIRWAGGNCEGYVGKHGEGPRVPWEDVALRDIAAVAGEQ